MSKRKHRKTRKQKLQKQRNSQYTVVKNTTKDLEDVDFEPKPQKKEVKSTIDTHTLSHQYVKQDVIHSLLIVFFILIAFGIFYFTLNYTDLGESVYGVIKL